MKFHEIVVAVAVPFCVRFPPIIPNITQTTSHTTQTPNGSLRHSFYLPQDSKTNLSAALAVRFNKIC